MAQLPGRASPSLSSATALSQLPPLVVPSPPNHSSFGLERWFADSVDLSLFDVNSCPVTPAKRPRLQGSAVIAEEIGSLGVVLVESPGEGTVVLVVVVVVVCWWWWARFLTRPRWWITGSLLLRDVALFADHVEQRPQAT